MILWKEIAYLVRVVFKNRLERLLGRFGARSPQTSTTGFFAFVVVIGAAEQVVSVVSVVNATNFCWAITTHVLKQLR